MLGEHVHQAKHIPATPWRELPDLFSRLDDGTTSGRALRWLILTCVRMDAARRAQVSEIDGAVWTVPADRIKGTVKAAIDFRVPLSAPALAIVDAARDVGFTPMFPGRGAAAITDAAVEKRLREIGEAGRPHGFRSSFRQWVQDADACSWEVAESILGQQVGSCVDRTYARSDMLERRRPIMEARVRSVTGEAAAEGVRPPR